MRRLNVSVIDISDLSIRLLANIADVMVIYTVFALARWYMFSPMYVHIGYLLGAVTVGAIFARYIEQMELQEKRQRLIVIAAGIVVSLAFALMISLQYGAGNLLIVFIMFLIVWSRAVKTAFTDLYGIFNIDSFYWGIGLIGAADLMIFLLKLMDRQRGMVSSCAVLYIVISLYLLSALKTKILHSNGTGEKRVSFDLAATGVTLLVALLFSSKGAMSAVLFLLGYVQEAVVWLVGVIAIPLGYAAVFLLEKVRFIFEAFWEGNIEDVSKRRAPGGELENNFNSAPIDHFVHIVVYVILIIAVIAAIYYIYKAMDRYLGRGQSRDYEESREFVVGLGQLRENLPKGLGALKDIYNGVVGRLLFNIRASTREKIRFEYKKFIRLLHTKELAVDEHTASNVCSTISGLYPQVDEFIIEITKMYEDIRYGAKEPTKEELSLFREYLGKVISVME